MPLRTSSAPARWTPDELRILDGPPLYLLRAVCLDILIRLEHQPGPDDEATLATMVGVLRRQCVRLLPPERVPDEPAPPLSRDAACNYARALLRALPSSPTPAPAPEAPPWSPEEGVTPPTLVHPHQLLADAQALALSQARVVDLEVQVAALLPSPTPAPAARPAGTRTRKRRRRKQTKITPRQLQAVEVLGRHNGDLAAAGDARWASPKPPCGSCATRR